MKKGTKHTLAAKALMRARKSGLWLQYFQRVEWLSRLEQRGVR